MRAGQETDAPVAVIGGGVVGVAVAYSLARRGVAALLLEAEDELALGASGTNSGILHTGFDSQPGELETRLILRSTELRGAVLDELGIPVLRCGAVLEPRGEDEAGTVASIAATAEANGVAATLREDGTLEVPGEGVTDPVAYTASLAGAAAGGGAEVRTGARVEAIERRDGRLDLGLAGGEIATCRVAVNCAGLRADEIARAAGDESFEIYPRKGEFFVFEPPAGEPLESIILPVPTKRTKGVLVFPTIDGKVVAGPTAHDQEDKADWSVRPEAWDEVMPKAALRYPPLEGAEPVASYAGLRPAGRGVNYLIGSSTACPGLINVAAIRSTGLSASLGIGEHVAALVAEHGVELGEDRPLDATPLAAGSGPWWQRTARYRGRAPVSTRLILGVDEGTTGVKAALFDEELRPLREARRDKVNRHPRPGWVEQDGEEVLSAVTEAISEVLADPPGEVVACGLDHQGESVLAWDAESGAPLSPIVVWQDKRSQAVLDRMSDDEEEIRRRSGLPFDPYFSAAKLAWLLENDDAVGAARDAGTLRMGTVDSFLCDRLGAGFATDASTASRTQLHTLGTPGFDPWLCERFGVPPEVLPEVRDTAGELGTMRHQSWPIELPLRGQVVDQQAALAGAGCVVPGRVKATYGTGVFVLAHVGDQIPEPEGGLLPTVAWSLDGRVEYALDGGVFAAGAMLEWLCRELGLAEDPPALGELARSVDESAGARVLPGLAGLGAPWWRPGCPGRPGGDPWRHDRRQCRPGRARGDRLAGRRHRRRDPRERRGRKPPRRRRPHQRAAAAAAPGRRDRRSGRGGGRRRDGARRRRARRGRLGPDRIAPRGRRAAARSTAGSSRGATPISGEPPSTSAGAPSWQPPPRSTRPETGRARRRMRSRT